MWLVKIAPFLTADGKGFLTEDGIALGFVEKSLHLITDRTQRDVDRVKYLSNLWLGGSFTGTSDEKDEWFGEPKGAYNASDLNRIGNIVAYVADRLTQCGYQVSVNPKTDWTSANIPTPAQTAEYLSAVRNLRKVIAVLPTTPQAPEDMEGFTYNEANAIEQILVDLDLLLTNISLAWFYCGELYSGEVW